MMMEVSMRSGPVDHADPIYDDDSAPAEDCLLDGVMNEVSDATMENGNICQNFPNSANHSIARFMFTILGVSKHAL